MNIMPGSADAALGQVEVIQDAGTKSGYPAANALFESGVDTVVYIHLFSQEQKDRLKQDSKGNLILTGHYGSDSLGINPLIDAVEDLGVEVNCCNNMIRIRREDRTRNST